MDRKKNEVKVDHMLIEFSFNRSKMLFWRMLLLKRRMKSGRSRDYKEVSCGQSSVIRVLQEKRDQREIVTVCN